MFQTLKNGIGQLRMLVDSACHDWANDNMDGCCERLGEFARDARTLADQAEEAVRQSTQEATPD